METLTDLRVLTVAEDTLARAGLAALLNSLLGCHVVGQATPQGDLLEEIEASQPDIVLWDLGWEPEVAFEQLLAVLEDLPPTVSLLPENTEDRALTTAMARSGVRGLLLRDVDSTGLHAALQAVRHDLTVIDPRLGPALWQIDLPIGPGEEVLEDLTPRELEVLQLVSEGLSNKGIAHNLGISEHTVKFHLNAILGKLGAQSRTEAVVRATRAGLISL